MFQDSVDIHCHILPGLDDGAENLEQSANMAAIASSQGISHIVATPHYIYKETDYSMQYIQLKVSELNKFLKTQKININIYPGAEVHINPYLPQILKEYNLTLNMSRYVLVEFPMMFIPDYAQDVIYNLLATDFIPIIAHPERNREILKDPNTLYPFIKMGALSQVTASSIAGRLGDRIQNVSNILLKSRMAQLVGTDAHSDRTRSPRMNECIQVMHKILDEQTVYRILNVFPNMILKDSLIEPEQPVEYKQKKRYFSFFRRY